MALIILQDLGFSSKSLFFRIGKQRMQVGKGTGEGEKREKKKV